jgi:hypothetical protein
MFSRSTSKGHEDKALPPFLDLAERSMLPRRIVIEHPNLMPITRNARRRSRATAIASPAVPATIRSTGLAMTETPAAKAARRLSPSSPMGQG